jgi:hypothetical protein
MTERTPYVYLALAVAGLGITWFYNVQFFVETGGLDIVGFFAAGFVNSASSSLTLDVLIAAATGMVFFVVEGRRAGMKHLWIYLVLTTFVAFSFSLGLFLFMRARK